MMKRVHTEDTDTGGGNYFSDPKVNYEFIHSGCQLLNCVLGGGWPLGRISNIVGDRSSGKTLLAIEAMANFAKQYPKGKGRIYYRETEASFDEDYAEALGLPLGRVSFGEDDDWETVEDIFEDLDNVLKRHEASGEAGLYIIDSLDGLSDREELKRKIDTATFAGNKPKQMGALFRRLKKRIKRTRIHLMIISQVRTKIGIMFGDKTSRSGGSALDFYASQIIYLSHLKFIAETRNKVKRVIGLRVKVKCKKNKISVAQRTCSFFIEFGFGVNDIYASVEWLEEVGRLKDAGINKSGVDGYLEKSDGWTTEEYQEKAAELGAIVAKAWSEIETDFLPTRRKY